MMVAVPKVGTKESPKEKDNAKDNPKDIVQVTGTVGSPSGISSNDLAANGLRQNGIHN